MHASDVRHGAARRDADAVVARRGRSYLETEPAALAAPPEGDRALAEAKSYADLRLGSAADDEPPAGREPARELRHDLRRGRGRRLVRVLGGRVPHERDGTEQGEQDGVLSLHRPTIRSRSEAEKGTAGRC